MLCKSLKKGMLLTIKSPDKRGWMHLTAHERYSKKFKEIPRKFVVGSDVISFLMIMDGVKNLVKPGETFVYLGEKRMTAKSGESKKFRLVLVNGEVGFIEGMHVKHLSPVSPGGEFNEYYV